MTTTPTDGEVLLPCRCGGVPLCWDQTDTEFTVVCPEDKCCRQLTGYGEHEVREAWNAWMRVYRPAPQAGEAVAWKATWRDAGFAKGNVFESDPTELLIREGMTDIHVAALTIAAPQGVRDAWVSVKDGLPAEGVIVNTLRDCRMVTKNNIRGVHVQPGYVTKAYRTEYEWCVLTGTKYYGAVPNNGADTFGIVTHWQPLPAPPAMSEGGWNEN